MCLNLILLESKLVISRFSIHPIGRDTTLEQGNQSHPS